MAKVRSKSIQRIQSGLDDVADWDMEELIRGRRRAKDGSFKGRPTQLIPREVHDELARRVKSKVAHELRGWVMEQALPIMDRLAALHKIDDPEKFTREKQALDLQIKAVQDMLDRFVVGRTEKVEISGTLKHEAVIANVTIQRDDFADENWDDGQFVDAEIVDEDDPDEWDF